MSDPGKSPPRRSDWPVTLAWLMGVGLWLRVAAADLVHWYTQRKGVLCVFPDTTIYWELASRVARGEPYELTFFGALPHFALRTPGYPLFLAACQVAFGERLLPVRIVQSMLGAACVVLTARLVQAVLPESGPQTGRRQVWTVPLIAAALVALDPFVVANSALILSEALFLPLMLLAQWALAKLWISQNEPNPDPAPAESGFLRNEPNPDSALTKNALSQNEPNPDPALSKNAVSQNEPNPDPASAEPGILRNEPNPAPPLTKNAILQNEPNPQPSLEENAFSQNEPNPDPPRTKNAFSENEPNPDQALSINAFSQNEPNRDLFRSASRTAFWACVAGAASGAATLVRPAWALYPPLTLGVWVILSGRGGALRATWRAVLVAVAVAAVMAPWWVRNASLYGRFVPTALWMGASLYDGLSPTATGASDMRFLESPEFWPLDEETQDTVLRNEAIGFARSHPRRTLELAAIKAARFWSPWPNAEGFRSPLLAVASVALVVPQYVLIAVGAWDRRRDPRTLTLLGLPLVYTFLLHLVFVSSMRYRVPVIVPAFGLAAIGLRSALTRHRRWFYPSQP